jgi:ribosome-associated protein
MRLPLRPQLPSSSFRKRRSKLPDIIETVKSAAEDKKAEDISVLDLDGRTIVADTFVIVTGRSSVQTRAIADAIIEKTKEAGYGVARTEGYADGGWILIDLGSVVAHVFTPENRAFYNLERLWGSNPSARISGAQ